MIEGTTEFLLGSILTYGIIGVLCAMLFIYLYIAFYYRSKKFLALKNRLKNHRENCNAMNEHIENLKSTYTNIKKSDCGKAFLLDESKYQYARTCEVNAIQSENIYDCSAAVCKNAQMQPFKYLCKYFNISATEEALAQFECVLNNFSAAEDGKVLLNMEHQKIKQSISKDIPLLIKLCQKNKYMAKLGFQEVDLENLYFPVYTFRYISPGGNKTTTCNIVLDIENLNKFVQYLADMIKTKKSVAGQRALMTSALRRKIKVRDNYTCKNCKISIKQEPHLLLEIDHKIPLSKGGQTTENNLQTLCWQCNRRKGAKPQ